MKTLFSLFVLGLLGVVMASTPAEAKTDDSHPGQYTTYCCTPAGSCNTGVAAPVGTPCWCNVPGGTVAGNAC